MVKTYYTTRSTMPGREPEAFFRAAGCTIEGSDVAPTTTPGNVRGRLRAAMEGWAPDFPLLYDSRMWRSAGEQQAMFLGTVRYLEGL
jgi:hypothetical protein